MKVREVIKRLEVDGWFRIRSTGKSRAEVKKLIAKAVPAHLEGLIEDGLPIPEPTSECEYVEVCVS